MSKILELKNCYKIYKNGTNAVTNISLAVEKGDFFALLGPNGAGKTTIISAISSTINLTKGDIFIADAKLTSDAWISKNKIGVMPQEVNFNVFITPMQALMYNAGLHGITKKQALPKIESLLKSLNMWQRRDNLIKTLSGGYKRRLMLARAMIHSPEILLLDEPTAGVDVETRNATWDFIKQQNINGTTIILTTHYLEEAESLCSKVAIIDKGRMLRNENMRSLLESLEIESLILNLENEISKDLVIPGIEYQFIDNKTIEIAISKKDSTTSLVNQLSENNIKISRIRSKRNRLEEVFLKLTNTIES